MAAGYDRDLLNNIFKDREYVANMTAEQKRQCAFILNRTVSKQYPVDAQLFNKTKVNLANVVDIWADTLYNGKFVPKWVYTKSKGQSKAEKADIGVKDSVINEYCRRYGHSRKDVDSALLLIRDEMVKELKEFEAFMKDIESSNDRLNTKSTKTNDRENGETDNGGSSESCSSLF